MPRLARRPVPLRFCFGGQSVHRSTSLPLRVLFFFLPEPQSDPDEGEEIEFFTPPRDDAVSVFGEHNGKHVSSTVGGCDNL